MIKLEVINDEEQHFCVSTDGPARFEASVVNGCVILHGYVGLKVDMEQDPDIIYDGTEAEPGGGGNESYMRLDKGTEVINLPCDKCRDNKYITVNLGDAYLAHQEPCPKCSPNGPAYPDIED